MPTLEETVLAARAGDTAAFRLLIERNGPPAVRVAELILGSRPDAEDAVQDACLRAWKDLPRLRDAARWDAWFRRLTVNSALDRARRRNRSATVALIDVDLAGEGDLATRAVVRDELRQLLDTLSPDERALVVLRYAVDLEVPDAATALGIPLGTAKSRLHRALAKLQARAQGAA